MSRIPPAYAGPLARLLPVRLPNLVLPPRSVIYLTSPYPAKFFILVAVDPSVSASPSPYTSSEDYNPVPSPVATSHATAASGIIPMTDMPLTLQIGSITKPSNRTPELAHQLFNGEYPVPPPLEDSPLAVAEALHIAQASYPLHSDVLKDGSLFEPIDLVSDSPKEHHILPLRKTFDRAAQRQFLHELDLKDDRIRAKVNQPFGKDNLTQFFLSSQPALRHVLLPLWKSGYLFDCRQSSWPALCVAYHPANTLRLLLSEYDQVDFNPLRGYSPTWDQETEVSNPRVAMTTAALLHFNGSTADTVRWVGGPHVAHHRDHHAILRRLKDSALCAPTYEHIKRILLQGIPGRCQVFGTEDNFQAYYSYGNHASVEADPEKTYNAMVKDYRKGYTLLFDQRLIPLLLNCHVTPQGVVDVDTPHRKPRPIFDSSFRPAPWCSAINDWTDKKWEPPLTFANAEMAFMIWVYNLRVTYPHEELYLADDDVSGAFRQLKYHPNLVAMHASVQCGFGCLNTGGTFGDNTTPSNFDPCGESRRHLSRFLWLECPGICGIVEPHLPPITTSPPPTAQEVAAFALADACPLNRGVIDACGNRLPPPYPMHVDDNLYADVLLHLCRSVCASAGGLFELFGWPTNPLVPSPLSMDKLETRYDHRRKMVGRLFDSRTLTVGMLPHKREHLLALLVEWASRTKFTLLDIAALLGTLESHTRYARWARCWYFALQNAVRRGLEKRYYALSRIQGRLATEEATLKTQLPTSLQSRLLSLISRSKAQFLWHSRQTFVVTSEARACLRALHQYVQDTSSPWATHLGLIVPRQPHFESFGDASHTGAGAYCPELCFWFEIVWSQRVVRGCRYLKSKQRGYVHINSLEFIVVILQLAAVITRFRTLPPALASRVFPSGVPSIPVWLGRTDNLVSRAWEVKATSKSSQGQALVAVYSGLLRLGRVHTMCTHVAGKANVVADDISRNDFSQPFPIRSSQLFQRHPCLKGFAYFLPSPALLRLLTSRLFSEHAPTQCVLPKNLGHFAPDSSTTSSSVVI